MTKVSNPIEMHHFTHPLYKASGGPHQTITVVLPISSNQAMFHKSDVIAMARHFNLTESDLDN